jgi:hypothetical protein
MLHAPGLAEPSNDTAERCHHHLLGCTPWCRAKEQDLVFLLADGVTSSSCSLCRSADLQIVEVCRCP